jgi:hypothetical protein
MLEPPMPEPPLTPPPADKVPMQTQPSAPPRAEPPGAVPMPRPRTFTFQEADLGRVPKGWFEPSKGNPPANDAGDGDFRVVADATGPSKTGYVLTRNFGHERGVISSLLAGHCIADDTMYKDVEVRIAFKLKQHPTPNGDSGCAGLLWRYQDRENQYAAVVHSRGVSIRTRAGTPGRIVVDNELASANVKVVVGKWYVLKITHVGNYIECFLDDKKLLETRDGAIEKGGRVGVSTTALMSSRLIGGTGTSLIDHLSVSEIGK